LSAPCAVIDNDVLPCIQLHENVGDIDDLAGRVRRERRGSRHRRIPENLGCGVSGTAKAADLKVERQQAPVFERLDAEVSLHLRLKGGPPFLANPFATKPTIQPNLTIQEAT
jgi:hypothetical protein